MPKVTHSDVGDRNAADLIADGGLAATTIKKRKKLGHSLEDFTKSNFEEDLGDILACNDVEKLQQVLINYFQGLKLNNGDLPSANYLQSIFSNIKCFIEGQTRGKVDLASGQFNQLHLLMRGLNKRIKIEGKGDTHHFEEVPEDVLKTLFASFRTIILIFEARKDGNLEEVISLVEKIPMIYRGQPHALLLQCVVITILLHDVRRGREGLCDLKKDVYTLNSWNNLKFFEKHLGEGTKNHKVGSEIIRNAGIILIEIPLMATMLEDLSSFILRH